LRDGNRYLKVHWASNYWFAAFDTEQSVDDVLSIVGSSAISDLGGFLKSQSAQPAGKSASNFFGSSLSTHIGTSISPLKVIHS